MWLFGAVVILSALGLVMVYSASAVYGIDRFGSDTHFALRQLIYLGAGLIALFFIQRADYSWLRKAARPLLIVSLILLVAVLLPGLGVKVGGAQRWFRLGPLSLQPSEFAKVALVLYLATLMADRERRVRSLWNGFAAPLLVVGLVTGLTLLQPDLGTAMLLGISALLMLFIAGTRLTYILLAGMVTAPMAWFAVVGTPWRMKRLMAFFDPEAHRDGAGYQVWEALLTLGSGGISGVGLGEGQQKLFYLPEAHTDFILPIVGQELGFVGVSAVLVLFGVILWRGSRVALASEDRFGTYLAIGFTGMLALQACLNMAVVVGVVPTKGITLPFVSYGGSSLVTSFLMVGVVLAVARGHRAFVASPEPRAAWGMRRLIGGRPAAPALQVTGPMERVRISSGGVWRAFQSRPSQTCGQVRTGASLSHARGEAP
jgi:cell division protein FtsW